MLPGDRVDLTVQDIKDILQDAGRSMESAVDLAWSHARKKVSPGNLDGIINEAIERAEILSLQRSCSPPKKEPLEELIGDMEKFDVETLGKMSAVRLFRAVDKFMNRVHVSSFTGQD